MKIKRRRLKWESDGEDRWIARMDTISLRVQREGNSDWYAIIREGEPGYLTEAGNPSHAMNIAAKDMRKHLRRAAIEWGVLRTEETA
jgi:hypothetical protein